MKIKPIIKNPLTSIFIVVLVFSIIYINGRNSEDDYREKVLNKPELTTGTVTNVEFKSRVGYEVQFYFSANNGEIHSKTSFGDIVSLQHFIINKQFPIIFSSVNPNYNMILILPEDFKDYNVPFPDSLNWVLQYVK
ncbi:hypothetical protein [Parafilimonas terrae]|uniref:Uncharacterized protein n=1 Tax=Parafilimonas terrae TaxID=1465490 RepID=A0A1I5XGY2_9BACT|nr:hypothetical protein [Parafilimonas terrae]SFQ31200.1 hypothetical protein SAMN05444277_108186 [Parafilimonas terrae]